MMADPTDFESAAEFSPTGTRAILRPLRGRHLKVAQTSGDRQQQRAYLWQARVALSIHRLGYEAQYEYRAGEGKQSIDFRVMSRPELLIEAIAIRNSQASNRAGWSKEMQGITTFGIALSSTNLDQCQTTAGEMVRVLDDCAQIALGLGQLSTMQTAHFFAAVPCMVFSMAATATQAQSALGKGSMASGYSAAGTLDRPMCCRPA
jgi:hypothetical protein